MKLFLFLVILFPFTALADFEKGRKAYVSGDYNKAFFEWQKSAEQDDVTAQKNIGHLYRWGKGVPLDLTQSAFWYYTAAKGGSDVAQYNLGVMYLRGEGIPRNEEEGIIWLERSAEQQNAKAIQKLKHLKTEIDQELPTEDDLLVSVKPLKKAIRNQEFSMVQNTKTPPLYGHIASYFDQQTLEKGWGEFKKTYPELDKFQTIETHVSLQKGKYIRLYIKGKPDAIRAMCAKLNTLKQYCLVGYP